MTYSRPYIPNDTNTPQVHILDWVDSNSTILEFGCAGGRHSKLLKSKGCRVTGIELDIELARAAQEICDEVIVADIADPNASFWKRIESDKYDYILLMDVLEHLPDPAKVLAHIAVAIGREKTKVVVAIPNVLVWHSRLRFLLGHFDYQETGILDSTHLRFFTHRTAGSLMEQAGLRICRKYVSWTLPIAPRLYSLLLIANTEGIEEKIEARGYDYPGVKPIVRMVRKINQLFLIRWLNLFLGIPTRISPGLFGNHFVFLAEPKRSDVG